MRDYSININPEILHPKSKKIQPQNGRRFNLKYLGILIFSVVTIGFIYSNLSRVIPKSIPVPTNLPLIGQKMTKDSLLNNIKTVVDQKGGTFSIYIYDLHKKEGYGINETTLSTAASVNKIMILAALYSLASQQKIDLDRTIILQKEDIQDYGTGTIRYDPPGTPYSLKMLARLMMEKSDNTAAHILGNVIIGLDKIQQMTETWGMIQTNMADNKTTAVDMKTLLVKMYRGEIADKRLTPEMLGFMDKSDLDDRLPLLLPKDIKIYHKTGDEIGKINDVGIIDLANRPYYLGVFTSDMTSEKEAKQTIAHISKLVFDYMRSSRN